MTAKGNTDARLWDALGTLGDDLLDINVSDAVADAELRALGVDAQALAMRAVAFVATVREERRLAWRVAAKERQLEMERRAAHVQVSSLLDRSALLARIEQLRAEDAQVGTAIKMAARKRKPEESTDDELRALLYEMETLRSLEDKES